VLFADTARIRSTGWYPRIALEDGLAGTLAWWRAQARSAA
jgi:nucleoside-diphosphate-sugar epimerase